jgi:hypothetical protein
MNLFQKSNSIAGIFMGVLLALVAAAGRADIPKVVPAAGEVLAPGYGAYLEPIPSSGDTNVSYENGVSGWSSPDERVVWYGQFPTAGRVDLRLALRLPPGEKSVLRLTVASWPSSRHSDRSPALTASVDGGTDEAMVSLGSFEVRRPGPYRFTLEGVSRSGPTFGAPDALLASGPGAAGAHFSLSKSRGAPSVHLWYSPPQDAKITWFYNEVTPTQTPLWSYFMACGFSRGYFGIQVNSPTERRIIFSVWDSGKEPTDRSKVAADDRVRLIAKGPGVFAGDFGNEGTGGHSHLIYPWKTGRTYRFLVSAQPDGTGTIYSGYFYFPEKKAWGLIASFRAPKDGGTLHGLYSFNEDFNGDNGYLRRYALFGPAWVRADEGTWSELTAASFTHTDDVRERPDRAGGVAGGRFFLSNGGYVPTGDIKYGDRFTRPASGTPPRDVALPSPAPVSMEATP